MTTKINVKYPAQGYIELTSTEKPMRIVVVYSGFTQPQLYNVIIELGDFMDVLSFPLMDIDGIKKCITEEDASSHIIRAIRNHDDIFSEQNVIDRNFSQMIADQSVKGINKYGRLLDNAHLSAQQVIRHAQEEVVDLWKYLENIKLAYNDLQVIDWYDGENQVHVKGHIYKDSGVIYISDKDDMLKCEIFLTKMHYANPLIIQVIINEKFRKGIDFHPNINLDNIYRILDGYYKYIPMCIANTLTRFWILSD